MKLTMLAAAVGLAATALVSGAEAKTFSRADANGDGIVSREEFNAQWGAAPRRFAFADANRDGVISKGEFWRTRPFARRALLPVRDPGR